MSRKLHADFVNGWDQDVLKSMLRDCQNPPVEEPANMACPALAPSYDQQKAFDCRYEGQIPDEPIGATGALRYLPGCVSANRYRVDSEVWTDVRSSCPESAVDSRHEGEAKLQPEDLQGRSEIRHAAFFVGLAIAKTIVQVGSHTEAFVHSDFLRTGPQAGVR